MKNNNSKIWFDVIERERLYDEGSWEGWIWFDVFEKDIKYQAGMTEATPADSIVTLVLVMTEANIPNKVQYSYK